MAIIKKFASYQNLTNFNVLVDDINPNSDYFRITDFKETFTGGKNGFLIEGSPFLKETTEVKIEILDVEGNPIYFEPGDGIPEYYEGISKLVSVHVYDDTPIGLGKITILGELKQYVDDRGVTRDIPEEWKGVYNVKWERTFQINKNLQNETIVRFYKRPQIQITELVKPIFSKSIPTVTDTVEVSGVPEIPVLDTDLSSWRAGTFYKLIRANGSWDTDVDENTITISALNYSPTIIEVLNDREVLVDIPYTQNNLVKSFVSQSSSVTYSDFQNQVVGESALTGSFAKIDMSQLKTFVGDVARVKIFRKSRNTAGDFQFVQESKLESTELLRDVTTQSDNEISYGNFTETNLDTYWTSSNVNHPISVDSSVLSQAVKVDYNNTQGGIQKLITSQSFSLSSDVEYTLSFKTLLNGSVDSNKYIKAYFSGSYTNNLGNEATYTQSFMHISASSIYNTRQDVSQNLLAERDIDAKLVFEFKGDDWYVSNISLRNAQETSFSPDEFTLIQDIPRKLAQETFDFRFEFYDINNNYIPVDVTATATFDGGNDFPTSDKLLTFESDRNAFRFSSGSIANPVNQTIQFKTTINNLTGSILFTSQAFDVGGNLITSESYHDSGTLVYGSNWTGSYPGLLTNITSAGSLITISNFSGSLDNENVPSESIIRVGSIVYTASLENLQEFETVYRLEDGDNAPQLIVTSNANQFIYEPTKLTPKPSGQSITVRAQRKNLASLITPLTINKSDSNGPDLNYVSTANGIDTYTISALQFSASFAENNFDEVTYSFTGSDVFGNQQTDEITLSKVINFDGVSIVLSNESVTFPAYSTGLVYGGFDESSGSVQMFIGGTEITHDDYDSDSARNRNTFDITSITENGVTATSTSPTNQYYSISGMSKDSGSLTLNIEYLAGDNSTSQSFQKIVSYNRARKSAPNIEFQIEPTSQTIESNSRGSGSATPQSLTVTAREGDSSKTVSITTPPTSITSGLSGTISSNTFTFTSNAASMSADTGLVTLAVSAVNSEGTTVNGSVTSTVSRTRAAVPNVEVAVTPSAQTIETDSLGNHIAATDVPQDLTVTALEGGVDRFTSIGTVTYGSGLAGTESGNTISFTSTPSSMTSDTATVTIPINYTDSEGTAGTKTVKATITKSKKAQPTITFSATPQAQTIDAKSTGVLIGTIQDVIISGFEGNTALNYNQGTLDVSEYKITNVTGVTVSDTTPNTSTIDITSFSGDTATGVATMAYKDSEGSTGTQTIKFTLSKAKNAPPSVNILASPQSQTVSYSTEDGYGDPGNVTIQVSEDGENFVYGTSGVKTFQITGVTGGSHSGTNTYITPTTPSTAAGTSGTVTLSYINSEGTTVTGKTIDFNVGVSAQGSNGANGPGVVFRGPWDETTIYYDTDDFETRRDAVLYDGTYYATKTNSTVNQNKQPDEETDFWESLGTDSFFVAAEIAIFRESYVQNTINVGTATSGNANITIHGGSTTPYISLGQADNSQAYNQNGIFIGSDGSNQVLSLKGADGSLLWDGSDLSITGEISADSGDIGGFTIGSTSIYKDKDSLTSSTAGVYLGTDGISLGASSTFKVTSDGALNASSATIQGAITATDITATTQGNIAGWSINANSLYNTGISLSTNDSGEKGLFIDNAQSTEAVAVHNGTAFRNTTSTTSNGNFSQPSTTHAVSGPIFGQNTPSTAGYTIYTSFTANRTLSTGGMFGITSGEIDNLILGSPDSYFLDRGTTTFVQTYHWFYLQVYNSANSFIGERLIAAGYVNYDGSYNKQITNLGTASIVLASGTYKTRIKHLIGVNYLASGDDVTLKPSQFSSANAVYATSGAKRSVELCQIGLKTTYGINGFTVNTTTGGGVDLLEVNGSSVFSGPATFNSIDSSIIDVDSLSVGEISLRSGVLTVNGDIRATGEIYALSTSDKRLKTNLNPITNPIDIIKKLNGYTFNWNEESNKSQNIEEVGVVAQEVQEILPQVVGTKADGYLGVKYDKIVAVLIEGIKSQQIQIDNLQNEIVELKKSIK